MQVRAHDIAPSKIKRQLIESIRKKAFWSYPHFYPSKVSDGKLIEKILIHGNHQQRLKLLDVYSLDKVRRVWERKLIIQEPRLRALNRKLAVDLFKISDPEKFIREAYAKHNLYDRFNT